MNYYISDIHFCTENKWDNRTKETDNIIIDKWNKKITNADDIYILGDIGLFGNKAQVEELIPKIAILKGKKHLIVGNHDRLDDIRIKQLFVEICYYKELYDGDKKIILSHYPILFWNKQHNGSILLYGHLHNSDEEVLFQKSLKEINEYFKEKEKKGVKNCPKAQAFNVGYMLDYMQEEPQTIKYILQINK